MVHQVASTDTMPGTVVFDWQVEAIEERTNK
jgi:hypothetical protein